MATKKHEPKKRPLIEPQPLPEWVRAACPCCGGPVVSNMYFQPGKGYIIMWECWHAYGDFPTCDYRRVL